MSNDKMRDEFEAWAASNGQPIDNDGGVYSTRSVDCLWVAWRASREALVIELPQEQPGYMYYAPDMVKAIEAAGVKCEVKP